MSLTEYGKQRRAFSLALMGIPAGLVLTACGQNEAPATPSAPLSPAIKPAVGGPDTRQITLEEKEFLMSQGIPEMTRDLLLTSADPTKDNAGTPMHSETRVSLMGVAISKLTAEQLSGLWEVTAFPPELRTIYETAGKSIGTDLRGIFKGKEMVVNNGVAFYDPEQRLFIKMIEKDTLPGNYLRDSFDTWKKAWGQAGMPKEMVDTIKLVEVPYNGKTYNALISPYGGETLEMYFQQLIRTAGPDVAKQTVNSLLQRFYLDTLLPLNKIGVYQKDLNFPDLLAITAADGKAVSAVPIDLDGRIILFEQSILPQWQYEQLVKRARGGGRNIQMPTFEELLAANPERFPPGFKPIEGGIRTIKMKVDGLPIEVEIPYQSVARSQGQVMKNIERAIRDTVQKKFSTTPRGEIIPVTVTNANGDQVTFSIIKTNPTTAEVAAYGGRWKNVWSALKDGAKIAADVMFIVWIGSEITQIIDPAYVAELYSTAAFPDSAISLGQTNISTNLDILHQTLLTAKRNIAYKATQFPPDKTALQFMGMMQEGEDVTTAYQREVLSLVTEYPKLFPNTSVVASHLSEIADQMIGPPAPTAVQFDSPVPLLLEGVSAEITNMWISPLAYTEDKIESKMLVVWSEVVINNEKQVIPISAMTKQTEDSSWQVHSLLPDDTQVSNISFSLYDGKFQFNCTTSPNGEGIIDNGNTLQMNCKIQPSSQ